MIIIVIVAALMLIALAYFKGEKRGDSIGYERGSFDGRQAARNDAAISAADVARRQRETAERARHTEAPKVIDDIPAVPAAPAPAAQAHTHGKRNRRNRSR